MTFHNLQQFKLNKKVEENHDAEHYDELDRTGFWGKAAAGCLFLAKESGRILFPLRSRSVLQPGTWGSWGGALDGNESPTEGIIREAEEEAGIRVQHHDVIPLYVFQKGSFKYHNFLVLVDKEFEPELNWETDDCEWVEFGQWPQPLHFGVEALFADKESFNTIQQYATKYKKG